MHRNECVIKIMRIKNGFKNNVLWNSFEDCEYVDVKVNVLIYDKFSKQSQVAEIQFLLKWLLHAKKV